MPEAEAIVAVTRKASLALASIGSGDRLRDADDDRRASQANVFGRAFGREHSEQALAGNDRYNREFVGQFSKTKFGGIIWTNGREFAPHDLHDAGLGPQCRKATREVAARHQPDQLPIHGHREILLKSLLRKGHESKQDVVRLNSREAAKHDRGGPNRSPTRARLSHREFLSAPIQTKNATRTSMGRIGWSNNPNAANTIAMP
jgi:hypothetical protein